MAEIDLRHLKYFISVAERAGFLEAARQVGVSQPAITKGIQRMEKWFGHPLFERGRDFRLTDFGRTILPRAKQVLAEYDDLQHSARLFEGLEVGSLRVGAGPLMAESILGLAIGRLMKRHPFLSVMILVEDYSRLPGRLREREIDLYVADISEMPVSPELEVIRLETHPFTWFCRKGHPLAGKRKVALAEILAFPIALPELPAWARRWFAKSLPAVRGGRAATAPFDPTVICSHFTTIKDIVLQSDTVSALTTIALDKECNRDCFARIDLDGEVPSSHPGVVHLRRRELSPAALKLIEELTPNVS